MKFDVFDVVMSLIIVIVVGLMALILVVAFDGYAKSNAVKAQYPPDFVSIIEQCGKHAASSTVVSGFTVESFNSGAFLSCATQHNVTFEVNGDAIKVNTNAD